MKITHQARRSIRYSIFIGVLAGSVFSASGAFAAITVNQDDFYEVISANMDEDYVLGENIDISKIADESAHEGPTVFVNFTGTLDGAGWTVSNLTTPLFGSIDGDSGTPTVKNLTLTTVSETGVSGNGALSNLAFAGSSIENVHAIGTVSGSTGVGGLVGFTYSDINIPNSGVTISNSSFTGSVEGTGFFIGGLVGYSAGDITGSYVNGSISTITNGRSIGGLAGEVYGDITNSYAVISGGINGENSVGGLAGEVYGDITNSYAVISGDINGENSVGGLAGEVYGDVTNAYAVIDGDTTGNLAVGGLAGQVSGNITNTYAHIRGSISGLDYLGGLVGYVGGEIQNSQATTTGSIVGNDLLGGLVGYGFSEIQNSQATTGFISGRNRIGGLVGGGNGGIADSQAIVKGSVYGLDFLGGLAGYENGDIADSQASTGSITGRSYIGGLVGQTMFNIENSDAEVQGNLTANAAHVGGLVGYFSNGSITNSDSNLSGSMSGMQAGGLIGSFYGGYVTGSYFALDNVVGGIETNNLFGYHYLANEWDLDYSNPSYVWDITPQSEFPSMLQVINSTDEPAIFATDKCLNESNPYLVSMRSTYESSCTTGPARSFRGVAEVRSVEKIEKTIGFKNDAPLPKDGVIAFVDSAAKFDVTKVKAVQIVPTENVKAVVKVGEALQISLNSESKEPVELWVKTPYGGWLLVGIITFDKDGKAVLPPLHFKNAGDYSLVLNKATADSANGSEPLNQSGSVLVEVN